MAAGRGTRMNELTKSTPKSMLKIAGRTLLEYKFDALPDEVDEIIVVVGYLGGIIHEKFGGDYFGKRMLYVEQEELNGTAGALWQAKDILKDRFLVMNGDNLYSLEDIRACAAQKDWAVVVQKSDMVRTGRVEVQDGRAMRIVENTDHTGGPGYACTNLFLLDRRIFDYPLVPKTEGSKEFGLPQTMMQAAAAIPIAAIEASWWIELKDAVDLQKAEEILASGA